jgi:hypothetical protein
MYKKVEQKNQSLLSALFSVTADVVAAAASTSQADQVTAAASASDAQTASVSTADASKLRCAEAKSASVS